jgi:hypothetical protein
MSTELSVGKPGYLSELPPTSYDNSDLALFTKPPQIKIIQAQTGPPYKPPLKQGDVIVKPRNIKIGDYETPFTFVPIHFFPSWVCLNPIDMKGILPTVREYSLDPTSELAKKCKSFAKEKCPENEKLTLKFSETLNFMIILEDNPDFVDMPIHLFCSRGEYVTGQQFVGDIQLRKAPRYACRFRAASGLHHNNKNQTWDGLNIYNDPQPWVADAATFHKYETFYKELKKLVDSRTLEVDLDDPETGDSPVQSEF